MMVLLGICYGVLAGSPVADQAPPAVGVAVEVERGQGDADAHLQRALWYEAHGQKAESLRSLALAIQADPKNATARGLMGMVPDEGRWRSPGMVAERVREDEALARALAEYDTRREVADDTAEGQWRLARWCQQRGLDSVARAHLVRVTQLAPGWEPA